METLLSHEPVVRVAAFFGALSLVALWELSAPRRGLAHSRAVRWAGNFAISILNTLFVRLVLPLLAVGMAVLAGQRGWGLFNAIALPDGLSLPITLIVLDLVFYAEHRLFHATPILWRLHRVHHSDQDYDFSTGLRFHPLEGLAFHAGNLAVIAMLGLPAGAVFAYEVVLSATTGFTHGNLRLPLVVDRALRVFIVTPDMHRVHHSVVRHETDSNFASILPAWDRLFGTYRAQPGAGHDGMSIGLTAFSDLKYLTVPWMLALPLLSPSRRQRGTASA